MTHVQIKCLCFKALKPLLFNLSDWLQLLLLVGFEQRSHINITACQPFQQCTVSGVKRLPQLSVQ